MTLRFAEQHERFISEPCELVHYANQRTICARFSDYPSNSGICDRICNITILLLSECLRQRNQALCIEPAPKGGPDHVKHSQS